MAQESCPACRPIEHLLTGVQRFRERYYETDNALMRDLADHGQAPPVLMISCSDSRVDPTLLSNAQPGELFTVRNVANLVPPYQFGASMHGTGAAIEYAVRDLEVDHVVVLGHAGCGGIKAMMNAAGGHWPDRDFIGDWVSLALNASKLYVDDPQGQDGVREVSLERLKENPGLVERAAILGSLANLLTYPWLKQRVEDGRLTLHGWWFDLETGDLWATAPGRMQLLPVV